MLDVQEPQGAATDRGQDRQEVVRAAVLQAELGEEDRQEVVRAAVLQARGGRGLDIVSNRCNFLPPRPAIGVGEALKIVSNTSRFGGLAHPYITVYRL